MSDLFEALKTFKNKVFVDFITRHEDAWEADASDDTPAKIDSFILTVRTKYNYMKDHELWDVVDPVNPKNLALATQLALVEKQLADAKVHTTAPNAGAFLTENKHTFVQNQFDKHRTQFVGPHTVIDGIAYDWCDKGNKSVVLPNGMYMSEGHNHEGWLQKKLARKNKSPSGGAPQEQISWADSTKSMKLTLLEQKKSCLMSKAGFSAEEASYLFQEMNLKYRAQILGGYCFSGSLCSTLWYCHRQV